MFVYLSKKIAIPNGVKLRSVSWNGDQGWIACGGENGLLKVLKLDSGKGANSGSNLSMNQTLEGHDKAISVVAWNEQYRKLTSSDANGLIIVWMLHKGLWFEEMINNRNKSVVRDVVWNPEGQKVCIVYEDGAVIVGGVDGQRLWGKELRRSLTHVTWSPDGRHLLFGTMQGEVLIHDGVSGQYQSKLNIVCVDEGSEQKLAGLQWHPTQNTDSGSSAPAHLAICYENGKAQMMRSEVDDRPVLIDTTLNVTAMKWDPPGTTLAIGGHPQAGSSSPKSPSAEKSFAIVQFYNQFGIHLRTLRVPGNNCAGLSWEGNGLRLALAIDSFIFFANVRPDYKWAYFNKTVVYAFNKPDKSESSVMFWNVGSGERNTKSLRRLVHVRASGDACALITRVEESSVQHVIQLCNAIGAPLENKYIEIEPTVSTMTAAHVIVASDEMVMVWQYRNPEVVVDALDPLSVSASRKDTKELMFHIEDNIQEGSGVASGQVKKGVTNDYVCALHANERYLYVARESGLIHVYSLAKAALVGKCTILGVRPQSIQVNCDDTMLAVIDVGGVLTMYTLKAAEFSTSTKPLEQVQGFERKDVWDMMWAEDNSALFAAMEKTRMYIFRNLEPEEPVQSSAHLCSFKNLKIRAVLLDDVLQQPDHPHKDLAINFETKSLRDTKEILQGVSVKEAFKYVEDHPHPKLWALLAEAALNSLDWVVAEKAVVRCKDYPAIQFVKRIKMLDDPLKQKAEVLAYYGKFDEAEKVYKDMDRKDLAVELRMRLGDWFKVVQLVQEGGGDESLIQNAWENIGDFYADKQKWTKAVQYYSQSKNYEKLADVYYTLEDFRGLEKLIDSAGHEKDILVDIGNKFLSVGNCESAVAAYLKASEVRLAVDACVELHQWDQAVRLAEEHNLSEISDYLAKYAAHLTEKQKIPQAIELFKKAAQHTEAAKLMAKLGQQCAQQQQPLKAKKFYVLAALEIEKFRQKQMASDIKSAQQVVDDLLLADKATASDRSLDSAWRGAEAFHFFLLCQQQLYAKDMDAALVTAMRLMEFDDLIPPQDAYSLIALTAYSAKNYGLCSRAFTRLEALEQGDKGDYVEGGGQSGDMTGGTEVVLDLMRSSVANSLSALSNRLQQGSSAGLGSSSVVLEEKPTKYASLAVKIFSKHPPVDTSIDRAKCAKCGTFSKEWARECVSCQNTFYACVATGRAVTGNMYWQCKTCKHRAYETDVNRYRNCPLCHAQR